MSIMARCTSNIPSNFIFLFILSHLMLIIMSNSRPLIDHHDTSTVLPQGILSSLDLATKLRFDSNAINSASTDYGKIIQSIPSAVLYPSSPLDISTLIKFSHNSSSPFPISAKGHGHSIRGQAMAENGIVINMRSLNNIGNRINISRKTSSWEDYYYVDAGGEQLWIDILQATLKRGLAPRSWTDYLYLTVGGTLSNAGMGGQAFRKGPQISNVYELDVITGKGETMTCSKYMNSELFYAVLGGLGQFGIITRARIALEPAPQRVKWVRMLYHDFSAFTRDQEHLISINGNDQAGMMIKGLDYIEGSLIMDQIPANNWRSSFFSPADFPRLTALTAKYSIIYSLEVAKYYNAASANVVNEELDLIFEGLSYIPSFKFTKDLSYLDFLNRVRPGELQLQSQGLWDVPHPWLNLFVPKSQISDFNSGVIHGIILEQNRTTTGPILVYPTNRNTWDDRMSAIIPDEDIFYSIALLHSNGMENWENLDDQNRDILQFCEKSGINITQYLPHYNTKSEWMNHFGSKWDLFQDQNRDILQFCEKSGINITQYLPHYNTKSEWMNHFGSKWDLFQERKTKFDPKAILSPGQRIFNSP